MCIAETDTKFLIEYIAPSNSPVQAWLHFRPGILEYIGYYYKYHRCVAFKVCVNTNHSPPVAAVHY